MKTAISIPDDVFAEFEVLAKERGMSRSRIYVLALSAFLEQQRGEKIREQLDKVYSTEDSSLDPVLKKLQAKALRHSEW